jgi:NAD(P)-dependent dehydrogenase (short-subunit alcohol dehydrogenase family)
MGARAPLHGRVAVVTGSTRGLGLAMARLLGRHGATVVLASRSDDHVRAAVDLLRAEGLTVHGRRCDTGAMADVEALRDEALAHGMLDIWVNNAGTSGVYGPTASTPPEDFERVVRTNILGTFHGARTALPVFLAQGHGDLVNLYGQGDRGPVALQNAYASSKRWVRQFTETLQREAKGTGVRVHGFNPGLVMTCWAASPPSAAMSSAWGRCRSSWASGDRLPTTPRAPCSTSSPRGPPSSGTSAGRRWWPADCAAS